MKNPRISILLATFILALLVVCLSRAQAPSRPLRVIDEKGVEHHTLMSDQHNALVGHLEAAGQTNALELLRQYRCAYSTELSSAELRDTLAALQFLREGRQDEAIRMLEQHLGLHTVLMCNSYGGLNPTNRERVNLESLKQTRDYYIKYPTSNWSPPTEAVDSILRYANEKPKK